MSVTYHIFPGSMIITAEGKTFTISRDDKKFSEIYDLIKNNDLETVGVIISGDLNYFKVRDRLLTALEGYEK